MEHRIEGIATECFRCESEECHEVDVSKGTVTIGDVKMSSIFLCKPCEEAYNDKFSQEGDKPTEGGDAPKVRDNEREIRGQRQLFVSLKGGRCERCIAPFTEAPEDQDLVVDGDRKNIYHRECYDVEMAELDAKIMEWENAVEMLRCGIPTDVGSGMFTLCGKIAEALVFHAPNNYLMEGTVGYPQEIATGVCAHHNLRFPTKMTMLVEAFQGWTVERTEDEE